MGVKCIHTELCDGCKICIEDCPVDVFQFDTTASKATIAHNQDCWDCFLCQDICPRKAIEVSPATMRKMWRAF